MVGFFCLFQNIKFKFEWDPLGILSWIFDNFFTDSSGILVSTWHDAAVAGQVSSNVKLKRRTRMSSDLRVVDKGLRGSKVNEGGHFFSLLLFFQLRFIKERRACGEASHTHVHTRTHTHTHMYTPTKVLVQNWLLLWCSVSLQSLGGLLPFTLFNDIQQHLTASNSLQQHQNEEWLLHRFLTLHHRSVFFHFLYVGLLMRKAENLSKKKTPATVQKL